MALVTKVVIPKAFWGCDKNFKLILHRTEHSRTVFLISKLSPSDVKEFINCRRFETLSLHHILQGFSTSECDWLMPPGTAVRNQSSVSVTDALKRTELLEDFVFWYFDSFVSSLLKVRGTYDSIMTTKDQEADKFLHHGIFGLQKQGALLSSRQLEDTLCTSDRTPYSWDVRENARGIYILSSTSPAITHGSPH